MQKLLNNSCKIIKRNYTNNVKFKDTGIGLVGCHNNTIMRLQIKVDDNGKIIKTTSQTYGSSFAFLSLSCVTKYIKNKNINSIDFNYKDIINNLKLSPENSEVQHCSLLAEKTLKVAINDYIKKNKK